MWTNYDKLRFLQKLSFLAAQGCGQGRILGVFFKTERHTAAKAASVKPHEALLASEIVIFVHII